MYGSRPLQPLSERIAPIKASYRNDPLRKPVTLILVTAPHPGEAERNDRGSRRGRQAEAERNDRRVLDAAREVFAEQGPGAPVSAVAQRAGVGMGSLYRRYGSKADLLAHLCLLAMMQTIEAAEAGLAEPDPWDGLAGYVRTCVGFGSGSLGALAGTIESTPEMWQTSRHSRELLDTLLTRAQQSGTVRPDVTALDIAWLIELFGRHGPTWPGDGSAASSGAVKNRLLAIALAGLRPAPADPLPGPAPTPHLYEHRWSPPDPTSPDPTSPDPTSPGPTPTPAPPHPA
jgi:AcrR family transcriptional regulator